MSEIFILCVLDSFLYEFHSASVIFHVIIGNIRDYCKIIDNIGDVDEIDNIDNVDDIEDEDNVDNVNEVDTVDNVNDIEYNMNVT